MLLEVSPKNLEVVPRELFVYKACQLATYFKALDLLKHNVYSALIYAHVIGRHFWLGHRKDIYGGTPCIHLRNKHHA